MSWQVQAFHFVAYWLGATILVGLALGGLALFVFLVRDLWKTRKR